MVFVKMPPRHLSHFTIPKFKNSLIWIVSKQHRRYPPAFPSKKSMQHPNSQQQQQQQQLIEVKEDEYDNNDVTTDQQILTEALQWIIRLYCNSANAYLEIRNLDQARRSAMAACVYSQNSESYIPDYHFRCVSGQW
mmetsp:Transcript_24155/g.36893  ORF Transcript_24155/g.36893 Transcript_24155/m.36893 type:complete len:136 (-) Transcript_24155:3883-4290(-)